MLKHTRKSLVYFVNGATSLHRSPVSSSVYFSTSTINKNDVITPTVYEWLTKKHHLSPQLASRVAPVVNHVKNPENPDSVISFLKENGFSNNQLNKILKVRPDLLGSNLNVTIKPKFKAFKELGFPESEISEILTKDPWILKHSLENRVIPSLSVLNGLLGSTQEVAKLLNISGWFLTRDLEKTLLPNIEVLVSHGVPMESILKAMYSFPRFFWSSPEIMTRNIERAYEFGFGEKPKVLLQAVRVLSSMSDKTLELKFMSFGELGFSRDNVLDIFKRAPQVFSVSMEKIKKIVEVLLATGKYDLSCIIRNPKALTNSIEKRFKPRLQVLGILESKKLIKKWPGIAQFYQHSDDMFFKKFVEPYLDEIGDVYMAKPTSGKNRRNIVIR